MAHRSARQIALALASGSLLLTSCGGVEVRESGDEGGQQAERKTGALELAVVPKAVGNDFWNVVKAGAECAAQQDDGVSIEWTGVTTEADVEGQVALVENFVTRRSDGIVYAATDSAALAPVTRKALDAGIPVAMIDSGTDPQPDSVPLYATDNHASAVKAADLLAEALGPGEHEVAMVEFQPGSQTNTERTEGFKEGLKRHSGLDLVAAQPSHSEVATARRVTDDILTSHPDLAGIFAANEPSVLGAAQAVEAAGRSDRISIIGWDAAPDEIAGLRSGQIDALVVQNPFRMGFLGVQSMVDHLRDGTPMESADTGVTLLTRKNIDSPEARAVLEPSCDNPPVG